MLKKSTKEEMPINAGDMGYPGETGGYLPAAAVNEARNASGLALEYYANWDASWFTPSQYFTNVATATCHYGTAMYSQCAKVHPYHK